MTDKQISTRFIGVVECAVGHPKRFDSDVLESAGGITPQCFRENGNKAWGAVVKGKPLYKQISTRFIGVVECAVGHPKRFDSDVSESAGGITPQCFRENGNKAWGTVVKKNPLSGK